MCPPTPRAQHKLKSHSWDRVGAHKPIWMFFLPTFFSLQDSGVSTQSPAPRKAGTIYRDLPLAELVCEEDVEQGMPKGTVRREKETTTFISRGMGDVRGRK